MQSGISFRSLKTSLFFLFILLFGCSVHAAQFTGDLTVISPGSEVVYNLKVKDNMYRIKKIKGLLFLPSLPTIYNRATGISWGLNPQMSQYVEQTDPVKTMMMNPIAGWEFMRRNLEATPAGTEMIEGYSCKILEYRQHGDTRVTNRVWVSPKLDFTLKEVSYALNGDVTLALKNIKKDPVDPSLFKIPPGYSKVVIEKGPRGDKTKSNAKKSAKDKKPLSKTLDVKRMSGHGISLKPDRHIIITATGNSLGGSVSSAYMKVLDKGNNEIIAEKITLQNGEIRIWEVTSDKEPWSLSLSGEKGLIKFKVDQLADEPAGALQTPQSAIEKPMVASSDEKSAAAPAKAPVKAAPEPAPAASAPAAPEAAPAAPEKPDAESAAPEAAPEPAEASAAAETTPSAPVEAAPAASAATDALAQ